MHSKLVLAFCLVALSAASAARVAAQPAAPSPVLGVALNTGWLDADGRHVGAVEIHLAPGWHTYWRMPGENGIPPQFDWSGSVNLASVAYEWPRPTMFRSAGATAIGYADQLVLPVILTPQVTDAPIDATLDIFFGVCKDICIPAEARLAATFDPDAEPGDRRAIEHALAARPKPAKAAGVTRARCTIAPRGDGHAISAEIDFLTPPGPGLTAVIEADGRPDLWIDAGETSTQGRRLRASARVEALRPGGLLIDRDGLRVTLLDQTRAIEIRGCPGR